MVNVKPLENMVGGTTIQKTVASLEEVPSLTGGSQFKVMVFETPAARKAIVGVEPTSAVTSAFPASISPLFPLREIDSTETSSP